MQTKEPVLSVRTVSFEGLSGEASAAQLLQPVKVQLGGIQTTIHEAVAFDLTPISKHHGLQISGFAGFPLFNQLVTTINLRSGWLRMASPSRQ